ncbi:MAG TPA: prepilin-type N-terminal cleavage/methylation domain-containing protein [Patescibacteria group bacterium]|nr:prepilin-type N-terminal cleavage/methylation domain-containing protein [Patescibacteria group bacterium]
MKFRQQFGFTLIEIIVVFAIIAIISTVAVASFVNYNKTQNLQVAVSDVTSILTLARSRALSQAKPADKCNDQTTLNGYKVTLFMQTNSYQLDVVCSNVNYKIQSVNLPKNVVFDNRTTSSFFYFPVIVNGVYMDGDGKIYLTGYGNTKIITVDKLGGIK